MEKTSQMIRFVATVFYKENGSVYALGDAFPSQHSNVYVFIEDEGWETAKHGSKPDGQDMAAMADLFVTQYP